MGRIIKYIYIASLVVFLFCACSKVDIEKRNQEDFISINVEKNEGIVTRSTSLYVSPNAKIHLYHGQVNALAPKCAFYTYNGVTWSNEWQSLAPLSWYGITKNINGKYPLYAVAPEALSDASQSEVLHDQSVVIAGYSNFEKSDQLMAYTTTMSKISTLSLTLQHLLSQIRIVFIPGVGDEAEVDAAFLQKVRCTLKGVQTAYSITYPTLPTEEIPATTIASGPAVLDVKPYIQSDATYTVLHNTILPPQTIGVGALTLEISVALSASDVRTAIWTNSTEIKLESGKCTVIKLNLFSQVELVLGDIKTNPWNETDLMGDFGY